MNIAGIGEVLWDVFPDGKQLGGAPTNVACHSKALGAASSCIISSIGNDDLGTSALQILRSRGIDVLAITVSDEFPTGVVNVVVDAQGKPEYEIKEGAAWDNIPSYTSQGISIDNLNAVCFGSLAQRNDVSRKTITKILEDLPESCLKVFDINLRQNFYNDKYVKRSLELATVFKVSDEELPYVAEIYGLTGSVQEILEQLLTTCELELIAYTRGPEGALMITSNETSDFEGVPTTVADTVGAGDSFTATMIMGYLLKKSLDEINERACRVAAFVCSQSGATPDIPNELKW